MKKFSLLSFIMLCIANNVYLQNPGVIGSNQILCPYSIPETLEFTVDPSGGVLSYTCWQVSTDNVNWEDTNEKGPGLYDFSPGALGEDRYYRVYVILGGTSGASYLYTNVVHIEVWPFISPGTIETDTDEPICYGTSAETISFGTESGPSGTSFSYQWSKMEEGGLWANISGATASTYDPGILTKTTSYKCTVGNTAESCGTTSYPSNTLKIEVYPEFNAGMIGENQTICSNTSPEKLSFAQMPVSEGSGISYKWQSKTGSSAWSDIKLSADPPDPVNLTSTTNYRFEMNTNCGTYHSNEVTITIPDPVNSGTIGSDQEICYNTVPEILSNISSPENGVPPYTFNWESSNDATDWDILIQDSENSEYLPANLTADTYFRRRVKDQCADALSNQLLISVKDPLPDPETNLEDIYCKNDSIALKVLNNRNTVQWLNANKEEIGADTFCIINPATENQQLYVLIKDSEDCASDTLSQIVTIDPVNADFTVSPSVVTPNSPVQFTPVYNNGTSYYWTLEEGITNTDFNPQYIYHDLGSIDISLAVTSENGCEATKTKIGAVTVSQQLAITNNYEEQIKLYPMPANNLLTVETGNFEGSQIIILSVSGKIMLDRQLYSNYTTIDISYLMPGLYIVKIVYDESLMFIQKMTKE